MGLLTFRFTYCIYLRGTRCWLFPSGESWWFSGSSVGQMHLSACSLTQSRNKMLIKNARIAAEAFPLVELEGTCFLLLLLIFL